MPQNISNSQKAEYLKKNMQTPLNGKTDWAGFNFPLNTL